MADFLRRFHHAARGHAVNHGLNIPYPQFCNRCFPNQRENVGFKIAHDAPRMVRLPAWQIVGVPTAGNGGKGIQQGRLPFLLGLLFGGGWVLPLCQQAAGILGGLAGFG